MHVIVPAITLRNASKFVYSLHLYCSQSVTEFLRLKVTLVLAKTYSCLVLTAFGKQGFLSTIFSGYIRFCRRR